MHDTPTVSLRDLVAAADDPRLAVLDVRSPQERSARPLCNAFFPVVFAPGETLASNRFAVATLLGGRHVVAVAAEERGAAQAASLLREVEVDCRALEDGMRGWAAAIVRAWCETLDDLRVVALQRLATDRTSYLVVAANGEALVLNPSGRVDCFVEELRRAGAAPIAVLDTLPTRDPLSCSDALCAQSGARYYGPDVCAGSLHRLAAAARQEPSFRCAEWPGWQSRKDGRAGATLPQP
jgi:hypothetical protein